MTSSSSSPVAVVLDHHHAVIYQLNQDEPKKWAINHENDYEINRDHLHLKASHFKGQRVPEDLTYYEAIAEAVGDARETLIFSHGKGKSSAGLMFLKFLSSHHHDMLDHVVGLESTDRLTDKQIIDHATHVFNNEDHRRRLGLTTH